VHPATVELGSIESSSRQTANQNVLQIPLYCTLPGGHSKEVWKAIAPLYLRDLVPTPAYQLFCYRCAL